MLNYQRVGTPIHDDCIPIGTHESNENPGFTPARSTDGSEPSHMRYRGRTKQHVSMRLVKDNEFPDSKPGVGNCPILGILDITL